MIFPPRGHLVKFGKISDYHDWGGGWILLVSSESTTKYIAIHTTTTTQKHTESKHQESLGGETLTYINYI